MFVIDKECFVFVIGVFGYIVFWIVCFLLEEGYMVYVIVRDKLKMEKVVYFIEIVSWELG